MFIRSVLFLLFVIHLLAACRQTPARTSVAGGAPPAPTPAEAIREGHMLLKNGDLVLRTDKDLVSSSLRNFSETDKTFSHCGIAYFEDSAWYIYHLMAGDENPSELIKREKFDSFANPYMKSGFGIFRYNLSEKEGAGFNRKIHDYMDEKIHFDKLFDLHSDDQLYCAEMVYKAIYIATNGRILLPTTTKNNFRPKYMQHNNKVLKRFEYVALDNLYLNPFCREIKRYHYPEISLERN